MQSNNQIPLELERPGVIGVHADEVMMVRSEARVALTFVQVYDVDQAKARGQVAAMVFLPVDKARDMSVKLSRLLAIE